MKMVIREHDQCKKKKKKTCSRGTFIEGSCFHKTVKNKLSPGLNHQIQAY